jgi:hypothetical protein
VQVRALGHRASQGKCEVRHFPRSIDTTENMPPVCEPNQPAIHDKRYIRNAVQHPVHYMLVQYVHKWRNMQRALWQGVRVWSPEQWGAPTAPWTR